MGPTPTPPLRDAVRRLLLIHPGALGDFVQALPAIGAVRAEHPGAAIGLLTGEDLASLAGSLGLVDDVLTVDLRAAYGESGAARARGLARAVAAVRRWRPDTVVTFKAAVPWTMIAASSGARRRVGLARGPLARALLTTSIDPPPDRHHEDRYADVARAAGADPGRAAPARWPDALPAGVDALFADGAPVVALAPGGARNIKTDMAEKRWPTERWAALAAELAAQRPSLRFALLGGHGDRPEADRVRKAVSANRVWDLVGRTTVAEARAVIAGAAACVVHDSGLLHVAATTATNVVAVFGPTDPRVLSPRRAGVTAVWAPAGPRACQDGRTGAVRACVTPCCMARVSLDAVLAVVRAALDAAPCPAPGTAPSASLVGR